MKFKSLGYCIFTWVVLAISTFSYGQKVTIPVETKNDALVLQTDSQDRLWTVYFGKRLSSKSDYEAVASQYHFSDDNAGLYNNAYTPSGTWNLSEPALEITHGDGNPSTELKLVHYQESQLSPNTTLTEIQLEDPVYKTGVTLFYKAYSEQNVIEQWVSITNREKQSIILNKYASANLFFAGKDFYLTSFQGGYLKEMQPFQEHLLQGVRAIESKLGTRAMLLGTPNFILSFGGPAKENSGKVILGQLAWSGNFKLEFEVDSHQSLRFIAGINPYESAYTLPAGVTFTTPPLVYSISNQGTGQASRQLQDWARNDRILEGKGERLTLLNNWESTYFDFDEAKLVNLIGDAKTLGVDMFLLDDGWFGNQFPRNNDHAGLGDWQENVKKLPHGLGYLVKAAKSKGVKFGIWIEPEMVDPQSELYNHHLDWVIRQPDRPEKYYRNQLVLDLANPEVQDFVFNIVDHLFTANPGLAFIKWDCNAVIYNAYSPYLHKNNLPQTELYVDYVMGLYHVLDRIRAKYPKVPMMLCSGGGGRADYSLLKYFTEFWPSDDTDPVERIFLQWNYSYFFAAIATDCHVTNWGKEPIKFRTDVASMGKLGFDINVSQLSKSDLAFCKSAVLNYNSFKDIIWHGNQYRLASPYINPYASILYVQADQKRAVMFTYLSDFRYRELATERPIKLEGLDPGKKIQDQRNQYVSWHRISTGFIQDLQW